MRILEQEAMMTEAEVVAYDLLVKKYFEILHAGFIETVINLSPASGKFLDIGTGSGRIAIGVGKFAPDSEVTGVDLSESMLGVARRNAESEGVSQKVAFRLGDAKGLPFDDNSFDAVFCHNMLHHLPHPEMMISEIKRVAKNEGAIIVRDLKRHSTVVTELHVNLFGLTYTKLMKKEYRDSIRASLSESEWHDLFNFAELGARGRITRQFITHQGIERPAISRRKDYIIVPTPFHVRLLKSLYVSKP
jgi:ubiquinone/menaquinone biosynthesis C-methylase UbiE